MNYNVKKNRNVIINKYNSIVKKGKKMFAIGVCIVIIIACLTIIVRLRREIKRQSQAGLTFTPKMWEGDNMVVTFRDAQGNLYPGAEMPKGLRMEFHGDDATKMFNLTFTTKPEE
jgi:hypothetical protein